MKKGFWLPLLAAVALTTGVACSDNDSSGDPEDTVALNMLDEDNGKTLLVNSGIYIDSGMNFVTGDDCLLFSAGKRGGLGSISPDSFDNPVPRIAVQSGHGYFAVRPRALRSFPSGAKALPIDGSTDYIRFYVLSPLKQGDRTVGAAVKYQVAEPETYGLPRFGSTVLTFNRATYDDERLTLTLPTSDFEYDFNDYGQVFECSKDGRKLHFRLVEYPDLGSYALWIRVRGSYTRVHVEVCD